LWLQKKTKKVTDVRTMLETSKTAQLMKNMRECGLDILGICENRWTGPRKIEI
jgi:hypothetical protein